MRWCRVNFQYLGVLRIWIRVGQGSTALAVGAGWGCLEIFSLVYHFSFHSPSLWETVRYRLEYCLKGPFSPKQPTNQPSDLIRLKPPSLSSTELNFIGIGLRDEEALLICLLLLNSLVLKTKIAEFANSVDLDEMAHNEPPHLDLHFLPSLNCQHDIA